MKYVSCIVLVFTHTRFRTDYHFLTSANIISYSITQDERIVHMYLGTNICRIKVRILRYKNNSAKYTIKLKKPKIV